MTLPDYWWLLTLATVGQALFFVLFMVLRARGKRVKEMPPVLWLSFVVGTMAGFGYGWGQSDPVFIVGQFLLVVIMAGIHKRDIK